MERASSSQEPTLQEKSSLHPKYHKRREDKLRIRAAIPSATE